MTFPNQIPLAFKEKWYIAQFPELSHKDCARSLNRLFSDNKGTRVGKTVYLFRGTDEYREMRQKIDIKNL
jgi:hypothetical protein